MKTWTEWKESKIPKGYLVSKAELAGLFCEFFAECAEDAEAVAGVSEKLGQDQESTRENLGRIIDVFKKIKKESIQ
jgi:hypothetical protein